MGYILATYDRHPPPFQTLMGYILPNYDRHPLTI